MLSESHFVTVLCSLPFPLLLVSQKRRSQNPVTYQTGAVFIVFLVHGDDLQEDFKVEIYSLLGIYLFFKKSFYIHDCFYICNCFHFFILIVLYL